MNNIAAIILAGGEGKRMGILSQAKPKPSLPFAGKFRVIDFSLSNCVYSGIDNVAVLIDYHRSYLADYISRWRLTNADNSNLRVLEPKNGSYKGTGDAVYQNLGYFSKNKTDTVLILAADHVYRFDYREMLAFHRKVNADVTIGVIPVPLAQAQRFGTVNVSAGDRIIDFNEKSTIPWSNLASMGIYIFDRQILEQSLLADAINPASPHDFGYSILPEVVKKHRVFAYKFHGYWQDIGTIETYYEANIELTGTRPRLSLNGHPPVLTQPQLFAPSCVSQQASVTNSLVSPGCVIRGHVENSVLSPQVWVDEGAVVRDSIIMGNTFIGRSSIIDGCILDEWVKIGTHAYIGLGHNAIPGDRDITIVGQGVTIPSRAIVGRNSKIMPDAAPSDVVACTIKTDEVFSGGLTPGIQTKDISAAKA